MKKLLFLMIASVGIFSTATAQQEECVKANVDLQLPQYSQTKGKAVNDTIANPGCTGASVTFYSGATGNAITGTFKLSDGSIITNVGQVLNTNGDNLKIYSILALTIGKSEGPSKGSFTASIHDTAGGITVTPMATSAPVAYDNVKDSTAVSILDQFTKFSFSTPVSVNAPFWAVVDVDNGSDTISFYSTQSGCGFGAVMAIEDTTWLMYSSVFTIGGAPITNSVYLWAEVEDASIGLDKNFISKDGLSFYPNPATEKATIEFDLPMENTLTLVVQDMAGREVYKTEKVFNGGDREFTLDVSNFEGGVYTYQVIGTQKQLNGVFVKK